MLRPAQLYADKLRKAELENWYKPENIYYDYWCGNCYANLPENNYEEHDFVSVDKNDNVIGYISYKVDWAVMSVDRFGAISFQKGNLEYVKDLFQAICDIFEKYHMNRMQWGCYTDNPAIRGYRNFIKRFGGCECGYYRQAAKLQDGKLHDYVQFEIMAYEFKGKQ